MKISNEFSVGIFAVLAMTLFFVGFKYLKGVDFFSSTKKYYAEYSNIDGLKKSNPVIINGYSVGRVSDINFIPIGNTSRIVVQMDIDGDILLGDSAKAILVNQDVLGSKAIRLDIGKINDNVRPEGDTLISQIDKSITDQLLDNVSPVATDIGSTIRKINTLLDNLNSQKGKIDTVLINSMNLTKNADLNIALTLQKVDEMVASINTLSKKFIETNESVKPTIKNLEEVTEELSKVEFKQLSDSVLALTSELKKITEELQNGEGTAGLLLKDEALYLDIDQTVRDLDSLIVDLNRNPKRYINFSVFGGKNKD